MQVLINELALRVVDIDTGRIIINAPSIDDALWLVGKCESYIIEVWFQWAGTYEVFDPILNDWVDFMVDAPGWKRI